MYFKEIIVDDDGVEIVCFFDTQTNIFVCFRLSSCLKRIKNLSYVFNPSALLKNLLFLKEKW